MGTDFEVTMNEYLPLRDVVFNTLRQAILRGELKPGDALPAERILAEEFGISRPALREVLKALSLLGITVSVHGGANYIAADLRNCLTEPLSILFHMYNSKIQDALQLRGALESKAAFLAAQNCTPLDAAELQLIIAKLDSTQDEKVRGDLDRDLHMKIAQISANPLILSVLNASAQLTENMITGIRSYFMKKNNDAPEIDSQHTRLVHAITDKDAPLAEKIMNEHMHTIERLLNEIPFNTLATADKDKSPATV
jgi:GntR family transcriptional repressor for pyruvate dehydrogenase complex